jgi:hypothetical protein
VTKQLKLRPIFTECDCKEWGHIRHPETEVHRPKTEAEAVQIWLHIASTAHCGSPNVDLWTSGDCLWNPPCRWHTGKRYLLICMPQGHVAGVRTKRSTSCLCSSSCS